MPTLRNLSARKILLFVTLAAVLVYAVCALGKVWIGNRIEAEISAKLRERGLGFFRAGSSWDPWRGLRFQRARIVARDTGRPVAESESVSIGLPILRMLAKDKSWKFRAAPLVLHDDKGSVALDFLTAEVRSQAGKTSFSKLKAASGGVAADLSGTILHDPAPASTPPPFALDLDPFRGTLAVLDVPAGHGKFEVGGTFSVDRRHGSERWKADLHGHGRALEWQGVRWREMKAAAALSSGKTSIACDLATAHGSLRGTVSREDWRDSPWVATGTLKDAAGQADEFRAIYQDRGFTLESLEGRADLPLLSQDLVEASLKVPESVRFSGFPMIEVRDLKRRPTEPRWTVGSVKLTAREPVTVTIDGREVELRDWSAAASYDGAGWQIEDSSASVFGGTVSLAGRYAGGVLSKARIAVEDIALASLKGLRGGARMASNPGIFSATFRGTWDRGGKRTEGRGSMRLEKAPVFDVPLLEQVYQIFEAVVPGLERSGEGRFEADYKTSGELVEVTRFDASGGTLKVSAVGTVNLKTSRVSGRARGKLDGLPGLVTSPLSRLLEMDVAGPFDDIRVKPLGPAKLVSNAASGVVGAPVDAVEEAAKITGAVLTEGVKLPFRWLDKDPPERKRKDR